MRLQRHSEAGALIGADSPGVPAPVERSVQGKLRRSNNAEMWSFNV